MADNTTLPLVTGSPGDVMRTVDNGSFKVPASVLTDKTGTNMAAVKASSTAAAATDPALVVSLSPNSPLPPQATTKFGTEVTPASTGLAKGSAGKLMSIYVENVGNPSTNVYLWLCDVNGAPLTGNLVANWTPLLVPAGGAVTYDQRLFGPDGLPFATAITWGISTSKTTYTQDATTHEVAGTYQ